MPSRLIQIVVPAAQSDRACDTLRNLEDVNWWRVEVDGDRDQVFVIAKPGQAQDIMDRLQDALEGQTDWRLLLLPVEGVAPEILTEEEQSQQRARSETFAREELLSDVQRNGALTWDFVVMVTLSTIVAAIGLTTDTVAVVIGAMVIAPLLGPLMAFALAVSLGARKMMLAAIVTNLAGIAICAVVGGLLAMVLPVTADARLLDYSQPMALSTVILPIASGAAAALSTASGKSAALVGVMVAAALLPPLVASGILLIGGDTDQGLRAAFIVITNIVGITLAAQVVFVLRGIRPRRWSDIKAAETSRAWHMAFLASLAVAIAVTVVLFDLP